MSSAPPSNSGPDFRGKRLFLSIDLPDYVCQALQTVVEPGLRGFHWVAPERYHLTLKFIGDFPGQYQHRIEEALDPISVRSFLLPIEGLGFFPPRGQPHAVWAGVANGHPHLFQLQKKIEDALFNIGIEPEKRLYQPHITIARVNQAAPETVRQFLKRNQPFSTAPIRVEAFHLMRSDVRHGHRIYLRERSWPLQPANAHSARMDS